MILLLGGVALVGAVWAVVVAPGWIRRTREAGGHWSLAAIVYLSGPINAVIQLTYPGGTPSGVGLLLARGNTVAAWTVGIVALLAAFRTPRPRVLVVLVPLLAYYASLYLSSAFGYRPTAVPEEYLITPLLLVPFVLHGGYTWTWLAAVLRRALRALIVLSLVAVPLLPSVAFDPETGRTLAGIERVQGITGHPNTLAILAVFAIILEIRGGRMRWILPALVALLLAQSTTGWVALSVGVLALAGSLGRSARAFAVLIGIGGVLFAVTDPAFVTDFLPPDFWTFTGRTTIWQAALHGFFLDPVLGYGSSLLNEQYRALYLGSFDAAAQAHNQFIQTLGETGLVGLGVLLVLLVGMIRTAFAARHATLGLSFALMLAFLARLVSETPLRPAGSTTTILIPIAVLGIMCAGTALRRAPDDAGLATPPVLEERVPRPPAPSRAGARR